MKGRHPKLNSHCWNDMKLAAGKKPDLAKKALKPGVFISPDMNIHPRSMHLGTYLAFWKTSMKGGRGTPLSEKIIVCLSMSMKQPTMSPSFHLGNWG